MAIFRASFLFPVVLLLLAPTIGAIAAEHPGYIEDSARCTTSIGKFYMGREIAFVMGHQAAEWLNRP